MGQLIAFVMDNFYVVLIIVGVIYSLFFRKSPIERPPNRMPDFGGGGRQRTGKSGEFKPNAEARTIGNKFPAPEVHQNASQGPAEQSSRIETHQRELKPNQNEVGVHALLGASMERLDEGSAKPVRRSQGSGGNQQRLPQPQQNKTSEAALSRDELSRAIMWAEILGPPRAKRPHRR